jgi:hypothetical protein
MLFQWYKFTSGDCCDYAVRLKLTDLFLLVMSMLSASCTASSSVLGFSAKIFFLNVMIIT